MDVLLSQLLGAHPGIYLDSRKYMRDTVNYLEQIRNRIGYDMELVHDVHERLQPIEAVKLAKN